MAAKGLIGDIGRYAIHDGPGIRSTVFFKGCPLRCPWCHNPEFVAGRPELAFYRERCLDCGDCLAVCPEGAILASDRGRIDRERCSVCGLCAGVCPSRALQVVGREYEVDQLADILGRDRLFYESSGGGITVSGGEPTLQLDFLAALLAELHGRGLHTAIETCGAFPWEDFETGCLDNLDLILFDVKIADAAAHRRITGADNRQILANLARLLARRPDDVIVRAPLVPGYTATAENREGLAGLFTELEVRRLSLLPYHPYGRSKAARIGRNPAADLPEISLAREELARWRDFFSDLVEIVAL